MLLTKEQLLTSLHENDADKSLKNFYDHFGPSVRSEYSLEGEDIVDLDWELSGVVVTFVNAKMNQIRLTVMSEEEQIFRGWIGDGVMAEMTQKQLQSSLKLSDDLFQKEENYTISYEFDDNVLRFVSINRP